MVNNQRPHNQARAQILEDINAEEELDLPVNNHQAQRRVSPPQNNQQNIDQPEDIPLIEAPRNNPQPQVYSPTNHNWQASHKSVKDRIVFLFNTETLSDVYFILGKGTAERQRIPAHKFVLSIGSVVFDAMFNGGFASDSCPEIEIPDIEPASFLTLLRFLYTDEVSIGPDTVMSTLYAAKKYAVPTLEATCVDFLKSNLGPDNAFTLLSQARLFDEPQLAEMCLLCIDKNTVDSLTAEGFTDVDYETLLAVLERDSLSARESQLFEAAVRWADHECRRQDIANVSLNKRFACL